MITDLLGAISRISRIAYINEDNDLLPYFFICGAGISSPEVPTAYEIVEKCKAIVKEYDEKYYSECCEVLNSSAVTPMQVYSKWIQFAYPDKIDRSSMFKTLSKESRISAANLRLAQILQSRKIAATVFTTNFDDMIKRALSLIGENEYFVSENAMDNLVVSTNNKEIQIIHVHGTYNFYDCANLSSEIRVITDQTGTTSSSHLLSTFLHHLTPIIIGYSGWEDDVIMMCLKERLKHAIPRNYIWVCYKLADYLSLPKWLKDDENIIFVVPDTEILECGENPQDFDSTIYSDNNSRLNKLEASKFLGALISKIKLKTPVIYSNPFLYFSTMIDKTLPKEEDVLHLRHWAQRMRSYGAMGAPFETQINNLEQASISKDYIVATDILRQICKETLSTADAEFVCKYLFSDFYEHDTSIQSVATKIDFFNVALNFIDINFTKLQKVNVIEPALMKIMFIRYNPKSQEEREMIKDVVSRIHHIAERDKGLLNVELTAVGVRSAASEDKDEKRRLLEELLSKCPQKTKDARFSFLRCQALIDLSRYQSKEDSLKSILNADKIVGDANDINLELRLMIRKSRMIGWEISSTIRKKWLGQIIDLLQASDGSHMYRETLELAKNLAQFEIKNKSSNPVIIKALEEFIHKQKFVDDYCESGLNYASICACLLKATKEFEVKASFIREILQCNSIIPLSCSAYLDLLLDITMISCGIPTTIFTDQEKIDQLMIINERFNNIDITTSRRRIRYLSALNQAASLSNECVYIEKGFEKDIEEYKQYRKITQGYDAYMEKDHLKAEKLFIDAMSCDIERIVQEAIVNLCFMIRRKETNIINQSFQELMDKLKEKTGLALMNTILFYISKQQINDPNYIEASNAISLLSENELEEIYRCWSNIELVGEEESKLALSLLADMTKLNKP